MQRIQLGASDLDVSVVGFGCMPLGGSWGDEPLAASTVETGVRALEAAVDAGINFFDHADIYCQGKSEQVFSSFLGRHPGMRDRIIVQSKCGIRLPGNGAAFTTYDFSRQHIVRSVEGSLRRLETDHLDVLLLHRPDPLVEPEEVAAAFDDLHDKGKVRWFGVSNHTAAQITLLAGHVRQLIVTNQLELNVVHAGLVDQGVIANREQPSEYDTTGTLEYCRMHGITIQPWSPLGKGLLVGREINAAEDSQGRWRAAAREIAALADEKQVRREAICIAWLLHHPAKMQPIFGSTQPERVQAAARGADVTLTREEWYRLFIAGRGGPLP